VPTYAVYLKPKTSFVTRISSDTLFGAICWATRAVRGVDELEAMLKRFRPGTTTDTRLPFALSSAFPFLRYNGIRIRFYPKPLISELHGDQTAPLAERQKHRYSVLRPFQRAQVAAIEKAKRVKEASYLSEELFKQIVCGETDTARLCERLVESSVTDPDVVRWGNALITHGERERVQAMELETFMAERDLQRNEIDRVALATAEGRLFFVHETFLHRERAGLWFVLQTEDLQFIKPLLRYLGDTGIGGERSIGKGHFEIPLEEIHEHTLPGADQPNCFVTLSRYIPANRECDFSVEPLAYTLTTIRPKHEAQMSAPGHHTYKRLLRVFEPGSFFPFQKRKDVYGQVVNVGRNADAGGLEVYHNGLALPVFAKIGGAL